MLPELTFVLLQAACILAQDGPIVITTDGAIQGTKRQTESGRLTTAFTLY